MHSMGGHADALTHHIFCFMSSGMNCCHKDVDSPLDPCVLTYAKHDDQGKYVPLGCLGVHVDDGIGGVLRSSWTCSNELSFGSSLDHSRLDSSSILG